MPNITVVNHAGEETTVDAAEDRTLTEVIRDNGFFAGVEWQIIATNSQIGH